MSRRWRGQQQRVATGLPSFAFNNGTRAQGPNGISLLGATGAYVTIGLETNPAVRAEQAAAWSEPGFLGFAQLVSLAVAAPSAGKPIGEWHYVADLGTYESRNDPDGKGPDSDPFGLLAEAPGNVVVVDAGGNSLLRVQLAVQSQPEQSGQGISTLAVFPRHRHPTDPNRLIDSVPTSVAVGPDGAYYVGELTGASFFDGTANIYRVPRTGLPAGQEPEVFLSGFKTIIDIAFDGDGNLYVLQYATGLTGLAGAGKLIRVAPDGTRKDVIEGLTMPTSVAVGSDGALYITNFGVSAGGGQVWRINPNAPPTATAPATATRTATATTTPATTSTPTMTPTVSPTP